MLAAAKMQLHLISESLPEQIMLKNVAGILEESIERTRSLFHRLRPAVLNHSGLIAGLEWRSGQMKEQFGLETVIEDRTDMLVGATPLNLFLLGAVQELLFNTVKHAGVKTALVECSSVNGKS